MSATITPMNVATMLTETQVVSFLSQRYGGNATGSAVSFLADPIAYVGYAEGQFWDDLTQWAERNVALPVVDEARTAQAQALATMRRREADALADRDRYRAEMVALRGALGGHVDYDSLVAAVERDVAIRAARIAIAEGYCREYDRIAEGANLPDRDDLRSDLEEEREILVTFRLTVSAMPGDDVDSDDVSSAIDDAVRWGNYDVETI